jgi:hypothetical protein
VAGRGKRPFVRIMDMVSMLTIRTPLCDHERRALLEHGRRLADKVREWGEWIKERAEF